MLNDALCQEDIDILCCQETWFNTTISDNMISYNSPFGVFRCDRDLVATRKKDGGRVCILINKKYNAKKVHFDISMKHFEICAIQIGDIIVANAYVPPKINTYFDLQKSLTYMKSLCNKILLFGDFNKPNISWKTDGTTLILLPQTRNNRNDTAFVNLMNKYDLKQLCDCKNSKGNVLDLLLTNVDNIHYTGSSKCIYTISLSHCAIICYENVVSSILHQ